jgi:hypothetical protein
MRQHQKPPYYNRSYVICIIRGFKADDKNFLEHIFKKMGSTEIVVSSVRPSVRLLFLNRYST